ncbi:MAG: hypothetical protein PWP04_1645 [Candidatus Atribacteria bacterium]|nr:hypothetical protein [Candidatus Atribacteria bacterium]
MQKVRGLLLGLVFFFFLNPWSGAAWMVEGESRWENKLYRFSWETGEKEVNLFIWEEDKVVLQAWADLEKPELLLVDEVNQIFSTLEDKESISLSLLFSLAVVLGAEEEYLMQKEVYFFPLSEVAFYPPFGECFPLKINQWQTGWYFKADYRPTLGDLLSPLVENLEQDTPFSSFWREMARLDGLVVARRDEEELVFRVWEVREIDALTEQEPVNTANYRAVSWVEFFAPRGLSE